ncbi:MAG: glycosyltransferase family 4 protein [Actinomycetota bacterium]
MNILVVEKTYPWPEVSGSHIRVANVVRALATLGEVDFFFLSRDRSIPDGAPVDEPVARFGAAPRAPSRHPRIPRNARLLGWLASSRLPVALGLRDYSEVRSIFRAWARPRYDLAWVGRALCHAAIGDHVLAPTVVDLDDLEDQRIGAWLEIAAGEGETNASTGGLRRWASRAVNTANVRRWRELQHRTASSVESVVVCSELDRLRLRAPNAAVIPNGYAEPVRPLGRVEVAAPPTLMLAGALGWAPNVDAARFLAAEVFPRLRARIPGAQLRIVGEHDDRVEDLRSLEGVTLAGFVPDMAAELLRADVVAVPIRFGSGTRVKILEAFAHRIPVVSTTLGCEGLDVIPGRHLLVADDAEAFARACMDLLVDVELRERLAAAAHELYRHRYRWPVIAPAIVELARGVAERRQSSRAPGHVAGGAG